MSDRSLPPNGDDRAAFVAAVDPGGALSDADIVDALSSTRARSLDKGQHFLRAGQMAAEVAIVVRGVLREYFVMSDGVERTKSFVEEGRASGSLADLLSGVPSRAFIVAEEPTRVLVTPFVRLRELASRSSAWAAVERSSLERLLATKAEREWELLGLDAAARYAAFRKRYPGIEARVAARHVASYVGITPVHLSRLRAPRSRSALTAPKPARSR